MPNAVRSLIEPPGFMPSILTHTSAMSGSTTRSSRTIGVRPMAEDTVGWAIVDMAATRLVQLDLPLDRDVAIERRAHRAVFLHGQLHGALGVLAIETLG